MILLLLLLYSIVLLISLLALTLSLSFFFGPPYVPTPRTTVAEMLKVAKVNEKDTVIDLGSGDGIILMESAKRGAKAIGWEINPFLVLLSKIRARTSKLDAKITVHMKPYQDADLGGATVIFCYNLPKFLPEIEKKIIKDARKDVKIIAYKFSMKHQKLIGRTSSGIFLYAKKQ